MAIATDLHPSAVYCAAQPVISFEDAGRTAAGHGTPLLAISRAAIHRNYHTLSTCLPGVEIFYAVKANPDPLVLTTLHDVGASADVCTSREVELARRAGIGPERVIHTHPCKSLRDLGESYALGVRRFAFDSPSELPKFAQAAPDARLLLRLAVPAGSSVINLSAKFGATPQEAPELIRAARRGGLHVEGLSFHVGSQAPEPDDFVAALTTARQVWDNAAALGCRLEVLDIGGGFPAPYREPVLSLEAYCRPVAAALAELFGDVPVRVIAEPGRCLVAEAVTLVTSVLGKSMRGGQPWYIIDDGRYGSFSGKAFDHADFPLLAEGAQQRTLWPCVVAGPTCDSEDVVSRDQLLPELEVGELLLVPSMGAYTSSSATDFNGIPRAQSVAVD